MTLDGYALTGLFVVMFGFLAFSAWVFEAHEPDPISSDRRNQAHPFSDPGDPFTARPEVPLRAGVRLDGSPGLRERPTSQPGLTRE